MLWDQCALFIMSQYYVSSQYGTRILTTESASLNCHSFKEQSQSMMTFVKTFYMKYVINAKTLTLKCFLFIFSPCLQYDNIFSCMKSSHTNKDMMQV